MCDYLVFPAKFSWFTKVTLKWMSCFMNMMFKNIFFSELFSLKTMTFEYTAYSFGMWTFEITDRCSGYHFGKLCRWIFYMMIGAALCGILLVIILYDTEVVQPDQARPAFSLINSSSCFWYSIWYGSCSQLEPRRCLFCSVMHNVSYSSGNKFPTVILVWYAYFANTGQPLDFLSLMHKTPFLDMICR